MILSSISAVYEPKYDLNKNGVVDAIDYSIFAMYAYKTVNPSDPMSVKCDFNKDGVIDHDDYQAFMDHYMTTGTYSEFSWTPLILIGAAVIGIVVMTRKKR